MSSSLSLGICVEDTVHIELVELLSGWLLRGVLNGGVAVFLLLSVFISFLDLSMKVNGLSFPEIIFYLNPFRIEIIFLVFKIFLDVTNNAILVNRTALIYFDVILAFHELIRSLNKHVIYLISTILIVYFSVLSKIFKFKIPPLDIFEVI